MSGSRMARQSLASSMSFVQFSSSSPTVQSTFAGLKGGRGRVVRRMALRVDGLSQVRKDAQRSRTW